MEHFDKSAVAPKILIHTKMCHPNFPSASGVEYWNGNYYGVGDDSPFLYRINSQFEIVEKILIKEYPVEENGRISKKLKPDFEAMAITEWEGRERSLIVGSGSKSPTRDKGYFIDMESCSVRECCLTNLYKSMMKQSNFSHGEELNIEGLAIGAEYVYFANRGNSGSNMIFIFPKESLFNHLLDNSSEMPRAGVVKVALPSVKNFVAGLSGIVHIPETNDFAFTASIEATDNAYEDGEILGSFVGIVPESKIIKSIESSIDLTNYCTALDEDGEKIITKVESIVVTEVEGASYRALLVSDNDNGPSEFFDITIQK